MHNHLYRAVGVLTVITLLSPVFVSAQATTTSTDLQAQIQSLLGELQSLQQQLQTLLASAASSTWPVASAKPPVPIPPGRGIWCASFGRDLAEGDSGGDVVSLQQILANDGFLAASSTGYFGPLTAQALARFQERFNIASSSVAGSFGQRTRAFMHDRCGTNEGAGSATSTPGMWWNPSGSSTPSVWGEGSTSRPMLPPLPPQPFVRPLPGISTTTQAIWNAVASSTREAWDMHASTTLPMPPIPPAPTVQPILPCADQATPENPAFISHAILPGMFNGPCVHHDAPMIHWISASSSVDR